MVNAMTSSGRVELSEKTREGAFVAHISVDDPDTGDNGVTECKLGDARFNLNSVYSNEYTLTTGNYTFDRESSRTFTVPLSCRDWGRPSLETSVEIIGQITDINDNPPRFSKRTYSTSINENNNRLWCHPQFGICSYHGHDNSPPPHIEGMTTTFYQPCMGR